MTPSEIITSISLPVASIAALIKAVTGLYQGDETETEEEE